MDEPIIENNEDNKTIVKRFFNPCDNVLCFDNMNCGYYYYTKYVSECYESGSLKYYNNYDDISIVFLFNSCGINVFNYKIVGYKDVDIYFYFSGIANTYNIKYDYDKNIYNAHINLILLINEKEIIRMTKRDTKNLKFFQKAKELEDYIQGQLVKQNFYGTNKKYNF